MDGPEQPHVLLDELRTKAASLEQLERRVSELEQIRSELFGDGQRLRQELEEYRQVLNQWEWFFENSLDILCVIGVDGYFRRVNKAFEAALGRGRDELLGRPIVDWVHPDDGAKTALELKALNDGKDTVGFETRWSHADGSWHWLAWTCPGRASNAPYLYAIARDVSERKRSEEEILFLAQHDVLTGLSNRAVFELELEQAIARTDRNRNNAVALFLLDLDGFKQINDTYGHPAGDHVLKEVAARLHSVLRKSDLVCRLGGDEFALLVEGPADTLSPPHVADKVLAAVGALIEWDGMPMVVGCSIGIVLYTGSGGNGIDLLTKADEALYAAKHGGKNCYRQFE
jgi:diguanylate cyclase (GGDEF)-like protein/PAS domain S-box-containing protein